MAERQPLAAYPLQLARFVPTLSTRANMTPSTPAVGAPPSTGFVRATSANGVGTLSFFHPKGNSLPATLLKELAEAVDRLAFDKSVQVIVLRSEGTGPFCAGASFDEFSRIDTAEAGRQFFMGFANLILAMRRCPKFIVARVHGKVAGGGVGIVAAADYSLAMVTASVRLSELAVGIGPFIVGPVIERRIGSGSFSAMAVDAEWRDGAWAERHGLYSRLCDVQTELDAHIESLAHTLARSNPDAMAEMKRMFWAGTEDWAELLPERAKMSGRLVLSDHTRKAIEAFKARG
jgi:methylglutaconyl-CoA hydratase